MNSMKGVVLLTLAVLFPAIARGQAPPSDAPAGVDAIDSYVSGMMEKHHVPGVSVAVVRDGKVILAKGYGLANVELNVPATEHTVYQLASVTKTFTATAIMLLVRDGKLALEDKVVDRLPDLPQAWKDVTVRHLLNHTSGIKSYTSVDGFEKQVRKDFAPREILDLVAGAPLEFAPGEKWNYSNTGYFLLGLLIEKASGKPYGEFMAERIFKPLGMTETRANDLHAVIPNRAQGYGWDGKSLRNGEYVSPTQPFAAGMLVSSVADLTKWDAGLASNALVDGPTLDLMATETKLTGGGTADYGLGWSVAKANGRRQMSHGGGIPGFSTEIARFPDDKLTVVVLTNLEGGHVSAIARGIAGRIVPELAEKPEEPIADTDGPTTKRLRDVLAGAVKGEVDPEQFTDEAKEKLVPLILADRERLATFGDLKSFDLLERKEAGGTLRLRYRAAFENVTLKITYVLDDAGKIQGARLQPEG